MPIDFSHPYICGRHGIRDHPECKNRKTAAQLRRRCLMTKAAFLFLMRRDGYKCRWCLRSGSKKYRRLTIDHLVPLHLGGTNMETNLILACEECNLLKGRMMPNDPRWIRLVADIRRRIGSYFDHKRRSEAIHRIL